MKWPLQGGESRRRRAHYLQPRQLSFLGWSWLALLLFGETASRLAPGRHRCFSDLPRPAVEKAVEEGKLRLSFGTACVPHPEKADKGGEDSFFACPNTRSFGVADGVGGFAESGIDSGQFARQLMQFAYESIRSGAEGSEADLEDALVTSAERLSSAQIPGGSTLLLGQLTGRELSVMNFGDSGLMLLRPATRTRPGLQKPMVFPRITFRSSEQTHFFNCPYQVQAVPEGEDIKPLLTPDATRIRVQIGDIVVAATDGIFDNLFDHELQAMVAQSLGEAWVKGKTVQSAHLTELAEKIAQRAQEVGQKQTQEILTPFMLAANSEGLYFAGGKLDDCSVVVGLVCQSDGPEYAAETEEQQGSLPLFHNFKVGEDSAAK